VRVGRVFCFFVGVGIETIERREREKTTKTLLFSLTTSTHRLGGIRARGEGRTHVARGLVGPVVMGERVKEEDERKREKKR